MDKLNAFEVKLKDLEQRVSRLEKDIMSISSKDRIKIRSDDFERKLSDKIDNVGIQNLVIIALKIKPKQTKTELTNLLLSWGTKKTVKGWFKGGNFKQRLLDNGIIMKDGENDENEGFFSLTKVKGNQMAKSLFEKYNL
ncbi:MAG: hypothetical protein WD512_00030 [Candidatus Paceibacterota bacterium]